MMQAFRQFFLELFAQVFIQFAPSCRLPLFGQRDILAHTALNVTRRLFAYACARAYTSQRICSQGV